MRLVLVVVLALPLDRRIQHTGTAAIVQVVAIAPLTGCVPQWLRRGYRSLPVYHVCHPIFKRVVRISVNSLFFACLPSS